MTVEAETTPALSEADFLDAVSAHLRKHPDLPPVNVDYMGHSLLIVGNSEWTDAAGLLLWAQSFDTPAISAHRPVDARLTITIRANAYSHTFEVWGWLPSEVLYLETGEHLDIAMAELAELAA